MQILAFDQQAQHQGGHYRRGSASIEMIRRTAPWVITARTCCMLH